MMEFLPNASHVISGMVQVGQNLRDEFGLLTARRVRLIRSPTSWRPASVVNGQGAILPEKPHPYRIIRAKGHVNQWFGIPVLARRQTLWLQPEGNHGEQVSLAFCCLV